MPIPSSGPVSTSMLNAEIGWGSNREISYGEPAVRALAERPTGQSVAASHMRGKTYWAARANDYIQIDTSMSSYWIYTTSNAIQVTHGPMTGINFFVAEFYHFMDDTTDSFILAEAWPGSLSFNALRQVYINGINFTPYYAPNEIETNAIPFRLAVLTTPALDESTPADVRIR